MANHQLHTHSHQETLTSVCQGTPSSNYHVLSKSSSNLASTRKTDSEERQSRKQELRKSLSSSACQGKARESDARSTSSSEWSSVHSEIASTVRTASSLSPSNSAQSGTKSTNHYLSVDKLSEPRERADPRMHVKSNATKNVSPGYDANSQQRSAMEELGATVQRSHSDLTCSCKRQSSTPHMETSATYAAMSSNGSYGASAGNMAFPRTGYGSNTSENASDFQSHVAQIPSLPNDQNVPANIFDIISHHQIFSDPGTNSTTVLESHAPGDNILDSAMYPQGGIMYSNFSSGMYPPGIVALQNSTALPYNIKQESAMKARGTSPTYSHSLPIQFIPRLVCSVSESGKEQVNPGYCPSLPDSGMAALPKLVSSVSESGLDAKRLLRYCGMHGEHGLHAQPYTQQRGAQQEMKTTYVMLNSCQDGTKVVLKTKDMWTMTSMNDMVRGLQPPLECKDAEVQTIPTKECKSVATSPSVVAAEDYPHMYPEVNLEPEAEGEKSPVREVRWDEEGMTWEVYGAGVDPETLGMAIQKHLEIQIEQLQSESVTLSRKSTEDVLPVKDEKRMSFRTMMYCLRNPSCCARSDTAVE